MQWYYLGIRGKNAKLKEVALDEDEEEKNLNSQRKEDVR